MLCAEEIAVHDYASGPVAVWNGAGLENRTGHDLLPERASAKSVRETSQAGC